MAGEDFSVTYLGGYVIALGEAASCHGPISTHIPTAVESRKPSQHETAENMAPSISGDTSEAK